MILVTLASGHYGWSEEAFARRLMTLLDSRVLNTQASAVAALNSMAFTAGGWTNIKKVIAELIIGSIAFPADLTAAGDGLAGGVTEFLIGTRDVSSGVT